MLESYNIQGQHKIILNNSKTNRERITEIYNISLSKKSQSKKVICLKYLISMDYYTNIPPLIELDSGLIKRNIMIYDNKLKESNIIVVDISNYIYKIKVLILDNNLISTVKMFHLKDGSCPLISIKGISNLNTSHVKNMSQMFFNCNILTSLPDISKWNTSNVTDMSCMFFGCSSLISLPDISN